MKNLLFVLITLLLFSCQEKTNMTAEDEADAILLKNAFRFELVGEVIDKMKTVTSIRIYKKADNTFLQELSGFEALVQENEQVIVDDLNFDNYADIRLLQFLPEDANIPFFYWLYNPKTKKFERNTQLEIISSPNIDRENELILSQWIDGEDTQGTDFYQYKGTKIVLMKQEIQQNINEENYTLTVKQPVGDSLQVVKQETFKREGEIKKSTAPIIDEEEMYSE